MKKILPVLAVAAACGVAQAQLALSVSYEVFYPQQQRVRDLFGATWQGIGISPSSVQIGEGLRADADFRFLTKEKGNNRVTLFTPSVGITQTFQQYANDGMLPYVSVRVGGTYADYRFTSGSSTFDRSRTVFNTNAEAGVVFNRRLRMAVRYDWSGKVDGLEFRGFSFSAAYQLLSF